MKKQIYHGSSEIVKKPVFGAGKPYNDYGLGFYCTEDPDLAKEWAVTPLRDGYANQYEIETEGLRIIDLNGSDYCALHWLTVLLENRTFDMPSPLAAEARDYLKATFRVDYEEADIILGYRADDSYFSYAQDFINGTISYRQLTRALTLGDLGQQFVLKSREAFEKIRFLGAEEALRPDWLAKKQIRDRSARRAYFDVEKNRREKGDLYITRILDEEMKENDRRLR